MASSQEILSEEELEALAEGVANGEVQVESDTGSGKANAVLYDFHQPAHLLKARLPALDLVNERFCKDFQKTLFNFMQRVVAIEPEEVQMLKFSDYINSLPVSTSVNRVRVNELNGSVLFTIESNLVYLVVDCFFGGPGVAAGSDEEREFTAAEKRMIEKLLNISFKDLESAWSSVSKLSFSYMQAENRSQLSGLADSSEVLVLSKFKVSMNEVSGELHIAMPHSLLEPLRPVLASGVKKGHADSDENWRKNLRAKLEEVEIDINAVFAEAEISLKELLSLKPGDFIPVSMSDATFVFSNDVPLFQGKLGMSNQQAAVRVDHWYHS